ncbi:uncharacterized protein DDB_G0290685-like [Mya arenaria]|uniref:uncharacterized protein DDB_G0290685-like n=1 Tax=Mya arenaria TaxID=6604 RepID=UPI0022E35164|nr:uncharacterized protein DDB_G0290685-like [Mya arenaria]
MGSSGSKPEKTKEKKKGITPSNSNQEDDNESEGPEMAQQNDNAVMPAPESLEDNMQKVSDANDAGIDSLADKKSCEDIPKNTNNAKDDNHTSRSGRNSSANDDDAHKTDTVTHAPPEVPTHATTKEIPSVPEGNSKIDANNGDDGGTKQVTNGSIDNKNTPVTEEQTVEEKNSNEDVKTKEDSNENHQKKRPSDLKEQTENNSDNDKVDKSKQEKNGNAQNESQPALKEQTEHKVDESNQDNNDNFQNGSPTGANEKKDTNSNKKGKDDKVGGKTKTTSKSKKKTKDTSSGFNKNQTVNIAQPPREEPKLNVEFYSNNIASKPYPGSTIEDMLEWKGDYKRLESGHSYIQWLFPIPEGPGLNYHAQALSEEEAKIIRNDDTMRDRVLQAYKMMLDFYGMELEDVNSGKVRRCETNWKERFEHLNRSYHNYMRITRIIKSLGELGFEHLQRGLVRFIITEAVVTKELNRMNGDSVNFWIQAIKDEHDQSDMYMYWQETCENPESFNKHGERKNTNEKADEDNGDNCGDQSGDKSDVEERKDGGKNDVFDMKSDENTKEIETGEEKKTCGEIDNGTNDDNKELNVNEGGNDAAVDENGKKDDRTMRDDRNCNKSDMEGEMSGSKNIVSSEKVDAKAGKTNQAEGKTICSDKDDETNNDGKKLQVNKGGKDGAVDDTAMRDDSDISGDRNGDKSDMEEGMNDEKNKVSEEESVANAAEKDQAEGKTICSDKDDKTNNDGKKLQVNKGGKDGAVDENAKRDDSDISGDRNGDKSDMEEGMNDGKNKVSEEESVANAAEKDQAEGTKSCSDVDGGSNNDSNELNVNEVGKDGAEDEHKAVNKSDTRDGSIVKSGKEIPDTPSEATGDLNGEGDEEDRTKPYMVTAL